MSAPLEGIRVLELTSVVLGPYACQMLGDLGAEIIKIEPLGGDTNRNLGPYRNDPKMAALFLSCNRNKRSVALNLKQPLGQQAALALAGRADVLVHNFRPQAMQRLGLDYERVRECNPQILYCATYGYSRKGPYGDRGALDDSIQAASGIAMLMSALGDEPRYLPTILADKVTGLMVAQSVLAALYHRERSGEGQEIEVPMFETMVSWIMLEHMWGLSFEPPIGHAGYTRIMSRERRPFPTKDGYLAVLPYWDNHWATFCELAGIEELIADPRFVDMSARLSNIDQTYIEVAKALAKRTTAQWLEAFAPTNVPHMVVNSIDQLVDDPHLKESGFWQLVDHPSEGQLRYPSPPANFSKTPASIRQPAPRLGEHSEEVLREAGIDASTLDEMRRLGVTNAPFES